MSGRPRKSHPGPPFNEFHFSEDDTPDFVERSTSFIAILYPDECLEHKNLMDYLQHNESMFRPIWIRHDKDYDEDGELLKPHYHVMINYRTTQRTYSVRKFFAVWYNKWQGVVSRDSQLLYFLHRTPDSFEKYQYPLSDMMGDREIISKLKGQNDYFVQFAEIVRTMKQSDGNLADFFENVFSRDVDEAGEIMHLFKGWQNVFCHMANQQFKISNIERENKK